MTLLQSRFPLGAAIAAAACLASIAAMVTALPTWDLVWLIGAAVFTALPLLVLSFVALALEVGDRNARRLVRRFFGVIVFAAIGYSTVYIGWACWFIWSAQRSGDGQAAFAIILGPMYAAVYAIPGVLLAAAPLLIPRLRFRLDQARTDATCIACGYSLAGLIRTRTSVCPECGGHISAP